MKNIINEWLEKNGIYSPRLRLKIANNAITIAAGKQIDVQLFNEWLTALCIDNVMNVGNYFLKCFETAVKNGEFLAVKNNPPAHSDQEVIKSPQLVEEFENSWDEWKQVLEEIDVRLPSKGVLVCDSNTGVLRAISNGDGGLIYIDGTVSSRYQSLNDLSRSECENLARSIEGANGLDRVVRKIREYGITS